MPITYGDMDHNTACDENWVIIMSIEFRNTSKVLYTYLLQLAISIIVKLYEKE